MEHGDEESFCSEILPHCAGDERNHVIPRLITRGWWRALGKLLQQAGLSDGQRKLITDTAIQRKQIIEHAEKENVITRILPHCAPDELNNVISLTIERRWWQASGELLRRDDLGDEQRKQIIRNVLDHCSYKTFGHAILPNCVADDLSYVIEQPRKKRLWKTFGKLLQWSDLSEEQRRRIISDVEQRRQMIRHAEEENVIMCILAYCAVEELDHVIAVSIKRRWWHPLGKLLQRGDLSGEQRRRIIDGAIKRGDEMSVYSTILRYCAGNELNHVMTQLIKRSWWRASVRLLQRGDMGQVHATIQHGDDAASRAGHDRPGLKHQVTSKLTNHDRLITALIEQGEWLSLVKLLQRSDLNEGQRRHIMGNAKQRRQIIEHANTESIVIYILPYCFVDEMNYVVSLLTERHWWQALGDLLHRGNLCDEQRRHIIGEVIQHVDETTFRCDFLPHCVRSQLDQVIPQLITRCWWQALGELSQWGDPRDHLRRKAIHKAIKRGDETHFCRYILHHCDEYLDYVIYRLTAKRWWRALGKLLTRGCLNVEQRRDIFAIFSRRKQKLRGNEEHFRHYILPHCTRGELDQLIPQLIKRRPSQQVLGELLQRCDLSKKMCRHIRKSISKCDETNSCRYTSPQSRPAGDDCDHVIAELVKRSWWPALGELLQWGDLSDKQYKHVINEVIRHGEERNFRCCILIHCARHELDYVILQLSAQHRWQTLGEMLQRGDLSDQQRRHITELVTKDGDERACRYCISRYGARHELDYVISQLITRGWWQTLGDLLQRDDLSDQQRRHIIEQVIQHGDERTHRHCISRHCARHEMDHVIPQLIKRRWWHTVVELLQWGDLSGKQRRHITDDSEKRRQLIQYAEHENVMKFILPYCVGDELDQVISQLITRCWWQTLGNLLQRDDLSDGQRRRIIENEEQRGQMIAHAEGDNIVKCILPYCAGDELDHVISQLIGRWWWQILGELLKRNDLSAQQRRHIIEEVIQFGDEITCRHNVSRHCAPNELEDVIYQLITRKRWQSLVELLLRPEPSKFQRRCIISQVVEHAEEITFRDYILLQCDLGDLDHVITQLIKRRWWRALGMLLHRQDLDAKQRKHITGEVIKHGDEKTHGHYISSHCARDALDCTIEQLIKQGWWQTLHELLQRNDLSAQQRQHITDARKRRLT